MIKVNNIDVWGFEHAIRGMRNPLNSWEKSDSNFNSGHNDKKIEIGKNDLDLMKRLYKAGTEHRKYARQIFVSMDITAPLYWIAEQDTYKIGTTRNSCSFMHKGVSKPFSINDFSVDDERIYYLLNPIEKDKIEKDKKDCYYPYETTEYKVYKCDNGREYLIYKNGRVFRKAFSYVDTKGRKRDFEECEVFPSQTKNGYFEINIGGRNKEKWLLHRLVGAMWLDNYVGFEDIKHIDGNKANNSVENLEWCWCSREENIKKGYETSLYGKNNLHLAYNNWKNTPKKVTPFKKAQICTLKEQGIPRTELATKYNLSIKTIDNITNIKPCENNDLFTSAYIWEKTISQLNDLRDLYLETKDFEYFRAIRQLLPQGYNVRYTYTMTYENVFSMINQRKNHKLDEWRTFVGILEDLPYIKEITE